MNSTYTLKPSKSIFQAPGFLLLVAILALLNNLEHSSHLYHSISNAMFETEWMNWTYCILVNLLIDLSVIAFVVNGRHIEAGLYAFLIFIINLLYYKGLNLFPDIVNERIAHITYSFMFTYSIYTFSKLYFEKISKESKTEDLNETLHSYEEKFHRMDESLKQLNESLTKKESELRSTNESMVALQETNRELFAFKAKRLEELTCKDCGHVAENDFGVSGHKKGCKSLK